MAQRTISTKLAVEGESEYKQAISNINNQLTTLNTKLGVVKSEFQNNQNSMEALSSKSEVLADKQKLLTEKVEECKAGYANAKSSLDQYETTVANTQAALEKNRTAQSQLSDEVKTAGTQWNEYKAKIADAEAQLKNLDNSTGDTSEEEKRLNDVIDESKTAMEQLNSSTGGMAEQAGNLQTEEAELNEKLSQAEAGMDSASRSCESWEQQTNRAQTQLNDTNAEIELNDKYLEEAANSADGCATSIDNFGNKTGTAAEKLDETNKSLDVMTAQMLQRELEKAFNALKDAIMACVDAAAEFEQQMSTVEAISGATSEEMNKLTEISKEMGSTTTYTATEAGEALEYMALAGWKTDDMLDALPDVLNLAAASGSDLATTSDIVTDALTAFGYQASDTAEFADTLAAASSNSNTTVEQLGSAFQKVGPLAGTMGYSVEDVSEALGLMANSGIKAESAGTALNTMLTRMSGTNSSARNELEKLNVEMYNADGTARPLSDVIGDLRGAFSDLSDSEATEAAYNLAGQRGMSAMLSIVQSSDEDYDKLADSIDNCNGAAKDMADTKLDNYAGQVTLLESAWDGLKVEIGEQITPALGDLVEWLTNIVNKITGFIEENPEVVAAISGIATTLGILTAALALLVAGMKIYDMVSKAISKMNPFGWAMAAVTAIAALTAGIAAFCSVLSKNYNPGVEESKERTKDLNNTMEELENTVEETSDAIEENADSTDYLKTAISKLLQQEQLSEAEKQKMADYVDELNELYPDLGLSIDETTGSLDMEADAFENLIDAAQDTSELTALAKEQEEAERAVAEAENDLTTAYDERDLVIAALNGDEEAYNKLKEEGSIKTGLLQGKTSALLKYENQLTKEIENGNDALDEAQGYYDDCTEACADLEKELSGLSDAEYDSYKKVGTQTQALCDDLLDLQHSYEDAQQSAKESAKEQFGMFDEVEKEATKSADDIKKALESQQKYWKEFTSNLQDLQGRNIDGLDEMVNAINDGSTEAAAYIASMADMTDEELTEMVKDYQGVQAEQDNYSAATADMATEYQKQVQNMIDEFAEWVNSNENLSEEDKAYMVQMMSEYVEDISESEEEYEGELEHIYGSTQEYFESSMELVKDSTDEAAQALDDFRGKTEEYSEILEPFCETMDGLETELEELRDKYNEVRDAAKESFDQQFDIFEQVGELAEHSQQEIMDALDSQIQYWADYEENFDDLCNRNIEGVEDLAQAFSDGSVESAGWLAYFRQASDDDIQQIIDKLGILSDQTTITAESIANDLTNLTGRTDEITQEMIGMLEDMFNEMDFSDEGYEWAMNSISAYVDGLEEGVGPSMDVIKDIVGVGGVIEALNFPDEAKQMAYDSIQRYADGLAEGETPSAEAIAIILEGVGKQFADQITDAEASGQDVTLGFGRGLSKGSSDAIETAKTETNAIMEAIKETAGTHSPSWITEDVGEDTMSGFSVGISNKEKDVENTARDAAQGAIDSFENTANGNALTQSGANTITGYINGVNSEKNDTTNALSSVANAGITTWNNSATHTVLFTSGVNTLKGYKDGLDSSKDTAYTKMQNIAQQCINQFSNTINNSNSMYVSGQNTIIGYINGLNSETGALYNSMQNIAKNALTSFNNQLGIHSPSTAFYESGDNSMLGYMDSISDNEREVTKTMAAAAQNAINSFDTGLDMDMATTATVGSISAGAGLNNADIDQNLTIYVTMPIYENNHYTKSEIVEIAMNGINHKQINQYAAKGVTL